MPLYEYQCLACKASFEVIQKIGGKPPVCPKCGHQETKRKVSLCSSPGTTAGGTDTCAPSGRIT